MLPLIPLFEKNLVPGKTVIIKYKSGYYNNSRGVNKKYKNEKI